MSRPSEYRFIPTDPADIIIWITSIYEEIMGVTVRPASPEQLFIRWMAEAFVLERVLTNYAANQNIPSRAVGENLDALAELFYTKKRPGATAATCTMRFTISAALDFAVLIPGGTRVTDASNTLVWETVEDIYVDAGETYADVKIQCQTKGAAGNGFVSGQINSIVDPFAYFLSCENLTESDGGADTATDEKFYELMRASMDGYSTAGPWGGYIYHAKKVSSEIADVVANSPTPGHVRIYVLMKDGAAATEEMKTAVLEACNPDEVRPMTDFVQMEDPATVTYDIDLTYYIPTNSPTSAALIEAGVASAVEEFKAWQSARLGRDINPSHLIHLLMQAGVKRVELRSPSFMQLRDGRLFPGLTYEYAETIPQIAAAGSVSVVNGGYEDE